MRACRPGHSCRAHAPGPLGRNACPATLPRAPGQEPQEPKWHLRFASCPGSERQPKSRASPQLSPLHVCKKTGPPLGRTPLGMLARTSQLHSSAQHLAPYKELPAPTRGVCAQRRHASTGALVPGYGAWQLVGRCTASCATSPIISASGQRQVPNTQGVHACTGWLHSGFTTATKKSPTAGAEFPTNAPRGLDHLGNAFVRVLKNECCKVRACKQAWGERPSESALRLAAPPRAEWKSEAVKCGRAY